MKQTLCARSGIKSVKFSGGDPGVYPDLLALTKAKAFATIFAAWVLLSGCVTSDGRPVVALPDPALANSLIPTPVVSTAEDQTKIQKNAVPTEERCKAICANAQARMFDESEKSILQTCREQSHCISKPSPPHP